jgi:Na+-transporting methylmalonyl-CoA/oxaloacetate decarboxylase gamma subunit
MDQAIFGLSVAVIGLTVAVLALVILLSRTKGASKAAGPAGQGQIGSWEALPASIAPGISEEVVAAITAAIAALWQGENGFVVRHIKRINNAPAWNKAGRGEQTYSRF